MEQGKGMENLGGAKIDWVFKQGHSEEVRSEFIHELWKEPAIENSGLETNFAYTINRKKLGMCAAR